MSGDMEINPWPTGTNCLSWSQDCELAVGVGEHVDILIPNLKSLPKYDRTRADADWTKVSLRTNYFTEDEVPLREPAGFNVFSIGQEISQSNVIALEWSATGLAKHRRCALAVLTSNLVLSIWESESRPTVSQSWKRAVVVNQEMEIHFEAMQDSEESQPEAEKAETRERRRRIRSFAWSPVTPPLLPSAKPQSCPGWGEHFVAVSNDNNEVVVFHVQSPYDLLLPHRAHWTVKVVHHFTAPSSLGASPALTFDEFIQQQRFVGHLAWSPWSAEDGSAESVLAYTTNTKLIFTRLRVPRQCSVSSLRIKPGKSSAYPLKAQLSAPLRWAPKIVDGRMRIVAFTADEIISLALSTASESSVMTSKHGLDEGWDDIVGMGFGCGQSKGIRVHFASHLSTTRAETASLALPLEAADTSSVPPWQRDIVQRQALFDAEHNLAGHALVKVWGLASSPLGDFVATCISLHPSDMLEYSIAAEQKAIVTIGRAFEEEATSSILGNGAISAIEGIPAETVLFSAKRWIASKTTSFDGGATPKEAILYDILHATGVAATLQSDNLVVEAESSPATLLHKPHEIAAALRARIYCSEDMVKMRYERLITSMCSPGENNESKDMAMILRLISGTLKSPLRLCAHSSISRRILRQYALILWKMQDLTRIKAEDIKSILNEEGGAEQCEICGATIELHSLSSARCANGHQFVRCGLTFLAIQAPSISKFCSVCGKQYLGSQFVLDQDYEQERIEHQGKASEMAQGRATSLPKHNSASEHLESLEDIDMVDAPLSDEINGRETGQPAGSLARMLFAACDACIYCGGKFVG